MHTPDFHPFPEFPTPRLLREANIQYSKLKKPIPVDENNDLLPYPTPTTKREKFTLSDYTHIDEHAVNVPESLTTVPMKDLVDHLCSVAKNDTGKVRVIFRWLTAQRVASIDVDKHKNASQDTTMAYLVKLKLGRGDYGTLFVNMCKLAGLQAKRLAGLVKGSSYNPGEEVPETSIGSWATVVIDKEWRLFDPHWSAVRATGGGFGEWDLIDDGGQGAKKRESSDYAMEYQHDESYFFTDPEEMIYSHLPDEGEKWQLLARPVTKREFSEMVVLKPPFFNLDLEVMSHKKCLIEAHDGEVQIELGLPRQRRRFMYRLWISSGEEKSDFKLDRFVFMQPRGLKLAAKISFPQAAKYKLDLFCRDAEEDTGESATYSIVCTYVVWSDTAKQEIQPLPENPRNEWGPGLDMFAMGMQPESHKDAVIEAENGTVQIRLKANKHLEVLNKIHSNSKTSEELNEYVLHQVEGEDIIIYVKVPERGEYALDLYAKEAGKEGSFQNVCCYLVTSDQGAFDADPYPAITNGRLGASAVGDQWGISCISHPGAFIEAPASGELEVNLSLPGDFVLDSHLFKRNGKEHADMDKYMFLTQDKKKATFQMHLPEAGFYSLKVFGKPNDNDGDSLPNAYNLVIHAPTSKMNCLPFPKSLTAFSTHHCHLENPTAGELPCNKQVPISLVIPDAARVATISTDGWSQLEKDDNGKWTGMGDTGDAGTQMKVSAEFAEGTNSFEILLMYDVKDDDDINATLRKQQEAKEKAEQQKQEEKERQRRRQDDIEKTKAELRDATANRDLNALKKLMFYVEKKRYVSHLKSEVDDASQLQKRLERIEQLNKAVTSMDAKTTSKISDCDSPPEGVHDVLVATLLVLGYDEGKTRDWENCQELLARGGDDNVVQRVRDFKHPNLHPEIAARARGILSGLRQDEVRENSEGAGVLYTWTLGMCEEVLGEESSNAKPASLDRQIEIFKGPNNGDETPIIVENIVAETHEHVCAEKPEDIPEKAHGKDVTGEEHSDMFSIGKLSGATTEGKPAPVEQQADESVPQTSTQAPLSQGPAQEGKDECTTTIWGAIILAIIAVGVAYYYS